MGSVTATVFTDVSVTFLGQKRDLQTDQSAAWTFNDPATAGSITYTYRIVPQSGLAAAVANQVVNTVAASLPPAAGARALRRRDAGPAAERSPAPTCPSCRR